MGKKKKINKYEPNKIVDYWIDETEKLIYVLGFVGGELRLGFQPLKKIKKELFPE